MCKFAIFEDFVENSPPNYHQMSQFWLPKMPVKFRQKIRHFSWLLFCKKISPTATKSSQIGEISPHLVTLPMNDWCCISCTSISTWCCQRWTSTATQHQQALANVWENLKSLHNVSILHWMMAYVLSYGVVCIHLQSGCGWQWTKLSRFEEQEQVFFNS